MQIESTMDRIRQGICSAMDDIGAEDATIEQETILVQDGHYCGRRFQSESMQAVWFLEEKQVKFSDNEGTLLAVHSVEQILHFAQKDVA